MHDKCRLFYVYVVRRMDITSGKVNQLTDTDICQMSVKNFVFLLIFLRPDYLTMMDMRWIYVLSADLSSIVAYRE